MSRYIMTVETVKIKDFLFSTNKLRIIRGASYLLDYLNQIVVPEILKNNGVKKEDIIYIGAGNAKFFVDSEDIAKKIANEVKKAYKIKAPNSKIVASFAKTEYKVGGDNSKNKRKIWEDIDKLAENTAIEKSKGFPMMNLDFIGVEKCELCGRNSAQISVENLERDLENIGLNVKDRKVILDNYSLKIVDLIDQIKKLTGISTDKEEKSEEEMQEKKGIICEECLRKLIFSNRVKDTESKKKISFYNNMKEEYKDDIELGTEISDYENGKSFIGFMYSDGDGLGDFLKNISEEFKKESNNPKVEEDYLGFLNKFSETLDKNTKDALLEAIKEIFDEKKDEKRFGEFLIVGGDDVCAVFNPELVLELSEKFQKIFEEKMKDYIQGTKAKDSSITSSSGVIIAKSKTPAFQLFEQALKLQKSAKAKRYEHSAKTGFIDFQVIGSEGCVDIDSFRKTINKKDEVKKKDNLVMERPYAIDIEESSKVKNVEKLFTTIKELKEIKFPKNKLRYIYELKRDEKLEDFEKKMEFINILSKMKDEHINFIKENYNIDYDYQEFEKYFNNIFDIVELYDFVGGEADEN
ncbi:Cas10/Cmr2 second palm domain-containing protein [Fusobacterium sp.]|uniref:Cas10/Cmr2 second palm domain-containing protein n=1 Tax=Fusobacterium sp. TaxID=68766 RepID=UPI002E787D82|nr:hypothetical protein [Fusobacterium sp.]MEE1476834.1 hypothetical protein [Fusobacterium sp.]